MLCFIFFSDVLRRIFVADDFQCDVYFLKWKGWSRRPPPLALPCKAEDVPSAVDGHPWMNPKRQEWLARSFSPKAGSEYERQDQLRKSSQPLRTQSSRLCAFVESHWASGAARSSCSWTESPQQPSTAIRDVFETSKLPNSLKQRHRDGYHGQVPEPESGRARHRGTCA